MPSSDPSRCSRSFGQTPDALPTVARPAYLPRSCSQLQRDAGTRQPPALGPAHSQPDMPALRVSPAQEPYGRVVKIT
ncbi:MAG: hypothetical protein OSJ32_05720 [Muribaculaceae bacterium]|nr:hypothetical protein [Muribaculaceae bacterium]